MVIRDRRFWPRVCACWRCWFGTKTNAPSRPARGQTTATPRSGAARDDRDPCQTDQADTDVQKSMFRLRMSGDGRSKLRLAQHVGKSQEPAACEYSCARG